MEKEGRFEVIQKAEKPKDLQSPERKNKRTRKYTFERLCKDVKEEKSFVHGETEDSMSGKVILEHLFQ